MQTYRLTYCVDGDTIKTAILTGETVGMGSLVPNTVIITAIDADSKPRQTYYLHTESFIALEPITPEEHTTDVPDVYRKALGG